MSRMNSKLVLKALPVVPDDPTGDTEQRFKIVKSTNTLEFGVPGDTLTRSKVDDILRAAERRQTNRTKFEVEFTQ